MTIADIESLPRRPAASSVPLPQHGRSIVALLVMSFALSLLCLGCAPDFSGFRVVEGRDGGAGVDAASVVDAGVEPVRDAGQPESDAGQPEPDAGPPEPTRVDLDCTEVWEDLRGEPGPCAGRRVVRIEEPASIARRVAIALTDSAVVLGWTILDGPDSGHIELVRLATTTDILRTGRAEIRPSTSLGEVTGRQLALSAQGERAYVAYTTGDSGDNSLLLRRWAPELLETAAVVATGLADVADIDVAAGPFGEAHVVFQHEDARATEYRRWSPDGTLGPRTTLGNDMAGDPPVRAVAASVQGEIPYAGWFAWDGFGVSVPHLGRADRTGSGIVPVPESGISGIGLDVDIGEHQNAVFLDWAGGQGSVQVVQGNGVTSPSVRTLGGREALPDMPRSYPLAIAEDPLGLLHVLRYDHGDSQGSLEYFRQVLPGRNWVQDTVSAGLDSSVNSVFVDMVVGPDRRPHIIFIAGGNVMYATIQL